MGVCDKPRQMDFLTLSTQNTLLPFFCIALRQNWEGGNFKSCRAGLRLVPTAMRVAHPRFSSYFLSSYWRLKRLETSETRISEWKRPCAELQGRKGPFGPSSADTLQNFIASSTSLPLFSSYAATTLYASEVSLASPDEPWSNSRPCSFESPSPASRAVGEVSAAPAETLSAADSTYITYKTSTISLTRSIAGSSRKFSH